MSTITFTDEVRQEACDACRKAMDNNNFEEITENLNEVCDQCKVIMNLMPELKEAYEKIKSAEEKLS